MLFIYNIAIFIYSQLLKLFSLFVPKAKLFVQGRKNLFKNIETALNTNQKTIWFHFASLGEFEQGRTVLEACKQHFTNHKIILTFFSPSGYEVRKNYNHADYIWYLPLDTSHNANKFINLIKPDFVVFTKYDFWYHYFNVLNHKKIPLYLIAGSFRNDQLFFKRYGNFYRNILKNINFFFLQNKTSESLLNSIGIVNTITTGDSRFDRVIENTKNASKNEIAEKFSNHHKVIVCGSTWPPDENILAEIAMDFPQLKFIIAPHEVHENNIKNIEAKFKSTVRYSSIINKKEDINNQQVLIIDNIGILSQLYQYAYLAYVGGGFETGLHNTQEPAAFSKSVIVGPHHAKFPEVGEMIALGACKSINSAKELKEILELNLLNEDTGKIAGEYIHQNGGATKIIMNYLKEKHPLI
ncbi:3-deoxy-D-manno-octulosonic acid transferase [Pedobacter flavus]|uniref:3-deoxy-D-manno-octulosonic acid transferase n=1 Tax=Pedobacter flavus TaxID=3113906 RepID=A0ABU7GY32_9SPHI|nr:glycosyltransferase N-terminal domain-containing protein [Pedobacter sp. VNH31]MEE1883972.1 glycosyltransferase N-terminal domain-containing protein [Pedobacter sp. VNH31]